MGFSQKTQQKKKLQNVSLKYLPTRSYTNSIHYKIRSHQDYILSC